MPSFCTFFLCYLCVFEVAFQLLFDDFGSAERNFSLFFIISQEVIEAIAECAFKTSPFPVILSFENHVDS